MEKVLAALRGSQDPELKEALDDPKSEVSRLLEAIRNRAAHAFDVRLEALGATEPEDEDVLSTLEAAGASGSMAASGMLKRRPASVTRVRVRLTRNRRTGVLGVANVTLNDEVTLHGIRILVGAEGPEVRFPKPSSDSSCLSCGASTGSGASFCSECGRRLPARPRVARFGFFTFTGAHVLDYVRRQVLEEYRRKLESTATARPISFGDRKSEQFMDVMQEGWSSGKTARDSVPSGPREASPVSGLPHRGEEDGLARPARRTTGAVLPGAGRSSAEPDASEATEEEFATTHPLLAQYFPSERRAIVVHWFFLCADENRRVPGSEAIERWEGGPAKSWRKRKFWEDMHVQLNEIDRHKYLLSEKAGRDVGWEFAAEDWIRKYSADWRAWWEQHCDPQ